MYDVHVVGGGPVGCIAAISSAREGHKVLLSEKDSESGKNVSCSGLISKKGLKSLKSFIDYEEFIINDFNGAKINFPGEEIFVNKRETVAHVIDRVGFEKRLFENANVEEVKTNLGERIDGRFNSDNIIGADGANSGVASYFEFPRIEKFVSTSQGEVNYESEDPGYVELYYSNKRFPGFFGWIIPHDSGKAEVGCGVVLPNNSNVALQELLFMKNLKIPKNIISSIIPIKTRKESWKEKDGKKIMLVGDAAGQVKSTTGGGIVFGGNCASLVGRYIGNPGEYEKEWKKRFGMDLLLHSKVQGFLEGRSEEELNNLGKFIKERKLDNYISNKGDMDKPTEMISLDFVGHFIRNLFG